MYSNERGSRFNLVDLIIRIIFFILFVLVLLWLFPKVPNMTPFYSNVFRENISYMQEAGEAYFTDDKMPTEIGQEVKITLSELFEKKLVLPFVDKDGNTCNQYDSYVSITKEKDESYSLKTNLVCNSESDYLIKILGCHNYCKGQNCEKTCHIEQITQYQYRKEVSNTITNYSCPNGYTKDGSKCYKSYVKDTKSAEVTTVVDTILSMPAKLVIQNETKLELPVNKVKKADTSKLVYDKLVVNTTPATTTTETYDCSTKSCNTVTNPTYSCNCTTTWYRGEAVTSCSTCGGGSYEVCNDVPKTCTREVPVAGSTTYSCPSTSTGHTGSGASMKCWHFDTIDNGYTYSCPSETSQMTGSNETLKCYKVTSGKKYYECTDSTYTLNGEVCNKKVTGTSTELKCDSGYSLVDNTCILYATEEKNASTSTSTTSSYKYTWSDKTSLFGWTKTGKTRTVDGEEVCE